MEGSYYDVSLLFKEQFPRFVVFLKERFSRFVVLLRKHYLQAGKDWRARWRQGALWLLAITWIVILLLSFFFLSALPAIHIYNTRSACQPDGSFTPDPSAYRYWSTSGFFQITLGFGNLNFTQAKAIDISWDVVSP